MSCENALEMGFVLKSFFAVFQERSAVVTASGKEKSIIRQAETANSAILISFAPHTWGQGRGRMLGGA